MKATAPSGRLLFTEHYAGFGNMTIQLFNVDYKAVVNSGLSGVHERAADAKLPPFPVLPRPPAAGLDRLSAAALMANHLHRHPRDRRRAGVAPAAIVNGVVKIMDHDRSRARGLECDRPHRRGAAADGLLDTGGNSETPRTLGSGIGRRWHLKAVAQRILRWQARQDWDEHWCCVGYVDDETGEEVSDLLFMGSIDENRRGIRGKSTIACGRSIGYRHGAGDGPAVPVTITQQHTTSAQGQILGATATVAGVFRCKSGWLCPGCETAAALALRHRVEALLRAVESRGGSTRFVTLTVRHDVRTSLRELCDIEKKAWRSMTTGASWKRIAKRFDIVGMPKVIEVTWGAEHGWHPHFHLEVVSNLNLSDADWEELWITLRCRWLRSVKRAGGSATMRGQDMTRHYGDEDQIERYCSKGSLRSCSRAATEIAGNYKKTGKLPGRMTIGEILAMAADSTDFETSSKFGALFLEYANEFSGKRQFILTPKLTQVFDIEVDDEPGDDLDSDEAGARDEVKLELDWAVWEAVNETRHGRALLVSLVAAGNRDEARFVVEQILFTPVAQRKRWRYRPPHQREFDRLMSSLLRRCVGSG